MGKIFLKKDGEVRSVDFFEKLGYENISKLIDFTNILLELNFKEEDIEVNFVEYPTLGNELLLDNRLNTELIEKDIDEHNKRAGIAIYIDDIDNDANEILLNGFKNEKISYICIVKEYNFIQNSLSMIHELNHFKDPYRSIADFVIQKVEGGYLQDNESYVKFKIRDLLNEYYATYHAYSQLPLILKISEIENYDLNDLFRSILWQLEGIVENLERENLEYLKQENKEYKHQVKVIDAIFYFFDKILRFFGKWDSFKTYGQPEFFQKVWNNLVENIKKSSLIKLDDFSIELRNIISPDIKDNLPIEEIYKFFFEFL